MTYLHLLYVKCMSLDLLLVMFSIPSTDINNHRGFFTCCSIPHRVSQIKVTYLKIEELKFGGVDGGGKKRPVGTSPYFNLCAL